MRRILSDDNADRRDVFTAKGREYPAAVALTATDRFIVDQMLEQLHAIAMQLGLLAARLRAFAKGGAEEEQEKRRALRSVPGVGEVTTEVVLAELGDVSRSRSARQVAAYAGLAPGRRESAGKARDLGSRSGARGCCGGSWWRRPGNWCDGRATGMRSTIA